MSDFLILILIVVLFLCLTVTLFGFVIYSGLLHSVEIKTGSPPVRNVTIAYKLKEGPSSQWGPTYKEFGASYAECTSIGPNLSSIGIFYDDPKQKASEKCRYAVGSVLSEGEEKPDEDLLKLYEQYGFKVFSLPEVSHAVTTCFPYTTPVSHVLASFRVYPELQAYIQERKLCAFPTIEICKADQTYYMVPLSRQTDFFVPEMRDEVKTELKEEDSDEDRGTDITGADSHSDGSSVSGGAPWDSRETSLAASTAASLASSLPLRDLGDGEEDGEHPSMQHREHGGADRGSDESVGSGSSFEELDMEPVEGLPVEEEEEEGGPVEEKVGGERGTEPEGNPAAAATTTEEDKVIEPLVVEPPRPEEIKALGGGEGEVEEE